MAERRASAYSNAANLASMPSHDRVPCGASERPSSREARWSLQEEPVALLLAALLLAASAAAVVVEVGVRRDRDLQRRGALAVVPAVGGGLAAVAIGVSEVAALRLHVAVEHHLAVRHHPQQPLAAGAS